MEDRELTPAARPVGDMRAVLTALNVCRSTAEKLLRTDPDFPAPFDTATKRQWFMDEIEIYKATRPRRIYTTIVAVLTVVSIAASFLANIWA